MEFPEKIVNFEYCKECKHQDLDDYIEPCHSCLNNPTNTHSKKPTGFEKKEVKKKKNKKEK